MKADKYLSHHDLPHKMTIHHVGGLKVF